MQPKIARGDYLVFLLSRPLAPWAVRRMKDDLPGFVSHFKFHARSLLPLSLSPSPPTPCPLCLAVQLQRVLARPPQAEASI